MLKVKLAVNAEAEQLKAKYPAIAAFAGAGAAAAVTSSDDIGEFSLDDLGLDEPRNESAAAAADDLDDAFDLSLDDLESDLGGDMQSAKAEEAPLSLDDDLDFGLVDEPAAPAAARHRAASVRPTARSLRMLANSCPDARRYHHP